MALQTIMFQTCSNTERSEGSWETKENLADQGKTVFGLLRNEPR